MKEEIKNDLVDFALEDGTFKTRLTENFKNRTPWEAPNDREIKAHIPGTIVKIVAQEGQAVKKGDLLLIHEAMKMQNRIEMPFDGVIAKINVTEGQSIPKHTVMVLIAE